MQKLWIVMITLAVSAAFMPAIIWFCKKHNLYDSMNSRKIHSGSIPRIGGIGIAISFLVGTLVYSLYYGGIELGRVMPLVASGMIIFVFGLIDDLHELPALLKLIVQLLAATLVVVFGYRFSYIFSFKLPMWFSLILTFGWIIGIINAFNLIDGLDGLCGGLSFIAFLSLAVTLYMINDTQGTLFLVLAAAVLGFLIFNYPPAKIFMGDCGSQFLGFMIAVAPLYETRKEFEYTEFFFMIVMVSIPMVDTLAAIWRRLREHKSIMHPDRFHVHHKLLNLGLNKVQALYSLLGLQILVCGIAVVSILIPNRPRSIVLMADFALVIVFYSWLHFAHKHKMHKAGLPADEKEQEEVVAESPADPAALAATAASAATEVTVASESPAVSETSVESDR